MMEKQKKYCKDNSLTFFMQENGICWSCKRHIEDTDKEHITGCPHCSRSFCDYMSQEVKYNTQTKEDAIDMINALIEEFNIEREELDL